MDYMSCLGTYNAHVLDFVEQTLSNEALKCKGTFLQLT